MDQVPPDYTPDRNGIPGTTTIVDDSFSLGEPNDWSISLDATTPSPPAIRAIGDLCVKLTACACLLIITLSYSM